MDRRTAMLFTLLYASASRASFVGATLSLPHRAAPILNHHHRSATIDMFLSAERRIALKTLDERRVISSIKSLATKLNRWKADEWRVLGAPPLEFSVRPQADGVCLCYFLASEAGRLTEDGTMDVALRGNAIVLSPNGKRRQSNEDVFYRLLLHAVRDGELSDCCSLAPGLYPPSAGAARLVAKIDAACLVDRKGQYKRF